MCVACNVICWILCGNMRLKSNHYSSSKKYNNNNNQKEVKWVLRSLCKFLRAVYLLYTVVYETLRVGKSKLGLSSITSECPLSSQGSLQSRQNHHHFDIAWHAHTNLTCTTRNKGYNPCIERRRRRSPVCAVVLPIVFAIRLILTNNMNFLTSSILFIYIYIYISFPYFFLPVVNVPYRPRRDGREFSEF